MHQQWFTSGMRSCGNGHWERVDDEDNWELADDEPAPDSRLQAAKAKLEWDRRPHHKRHDEWPHWGWGITPSSNEEDHRSHLREGDGWGRRRRSDAGSDGPRGFGTQDEVRKAVLGLHQGSAKD